MKIKSVILFLIDGLRPDGIEQAVTPNLDRLIKRGAYTFHAQTVFPSISFPAVASLFFSLPPERHGITDNIWTPAFQPMTGIFDAVHAAGKFTASFYCWEEYRNLSNIGSLDASFFLNYNSYEPGGDREIAALAARYLSQNTISFSWVYFARTDVVGEEYGWMSENYLKEVANIDAAMGMVLDVVRLEETVCIVTSDHGGHERTHGSNRPESMTIPIIIHGSGIPQSLEIKTSVSIMDIAPTIVTLLGINVPQEWAGKVISEVIPHT